MEVILRAFSGGLTLLLLMGCLWSCGDDRRDIRDYYFPVRELTDGLVYVYEPLGGPDTNSIYWYFRGVDRDTGLNLIVTTYGNDFSPATVINERITNGGVITEQVTIAKTDSTGRSQLSQAEVRAGNTFPFYVPVGAEQPAYVYQIRYAPPDEADVEYIITYNRQYQSDTLVEVMGDNYPALVFAISGETEVRDRVNGGMAPAFDGYEIYAKGIGLVESMRDYDGFVLHQRLRDRIGLEVLEQRARRAKALTIGE